jgi:hypothetical protein
MKIAILANEPYHNSFGLSLTLKELINRVDKFIPFNIGKEKLNEEIKNLKEFDCIITWFNPILLEIDSLSNLGKSLIMASCDIPKRLRDNLYKDIIKHHKPTGIIVENKCSIPVFKDYLGREDLDFFWFPWGIDENYVKDYNEEKIYDVSQTGQFNKYEFRREINILLEGKKNLNYYRTSPERGLDNQEKFTYDEYCKIINKSKISIGGCLQNKEFINYKGIFIGNTFPKNFEIPGCNSLLFNPNWGDKEILGFKNEENFIEFKNPRDCIRKIEYYLEQPELLKKISINGYNLIHNNHTNKIHTDKFLNEIHSRYK